MPSRILECESFVQFICSSIFHNQKTYEEIDAEWKRRLHRDKRIIHLHERWRGESPTKLYINVDVPTKMEKGYNVIRKQRDKFRKYVNIGIHCWDLVFGISILWMQSHGAQALNNWHAENMCEDSLYIKHMVSRDHSMPDCATDTSTKSIFLENAFVVIWLCQQMEMHTSYALC